MAEYERFELSGLNENIPDLFRSDDTSGFGLTIPLYVGLPPGSDPGDFVDDGHRFCCLGQNYGGCYITLETLVQGLDKEERIKLYRAVKSDPHHIPFLVWDKYGKLVSMPARLFVDPALYKARDKSKAARDEAEDAWDNAQKLLWHKVAVSADEATPSVPFNVYTRFADVPLNLNVNLIFSPAKDAMHVSLDNLRAAVGLAFADTELALPKYSFKTVSWNEAYDSDARLVGMHYLGFYYTWMTSAEYRTIWANRGLSVFSRPWPTGKTGILETIDQDLHQMGPHPKGGPVKTVPLSHHKVRAAIGQRPRFPGQKEVMGSTATMIAKKIWAANTLDANRSPADAEWLHRVAFHFGGVTSRYVDLGSSQTRANMVFGTSECNTHMIRAENAITSLLAADAKVSNDETHIGWLTTTNVTGNISKIECDATTTTAMIPSELADLKYLWLCFCLQYEWTMDCPSLHNSSFNVSTMFDPFSRYIPLRVEARLDDFILKHMVNGPWQTPIAVPPTSTMAPTTTTTASITTTSGAPTTSTTTTGASTIDTFTSKKQKLDPGEFITSTFAAGAPSTSKSNASAFSTSAFATSTPSTSKSTTSTSDSTTSKSAPAKFTTSRMALPASFHAADHRTTAISPVPQHNTQPHAAAAQLGSANIAGTKIMQPALAQPLKVDDVVSVDKPQASVLPPLPIGAPDTSPPHHGFVQKGDIALFGNPKLMVQIEVWQGPPPTGLVLGREAPSIERATLKEFHLSLLIPELGGSVFDDITLRNVTFYHQNYAYDPTKAVGWHINADLVIDESCGLLHKVLSQTFGVTQPTLSVHAGLGVNQGWNRKLAVHSFTLEGIFAKIDIKPFDGLHLTSIGVRLFGIRSTQFGPRPKSILKYAFGLFGSMNLNVPGSVVPLHLTYEIRAGDSLSLVAHLSGELWKNPLGIEGVKLADVLFSTSLAIDAPWESFQFEVSAAFQYRSTGAIFTGSYAPRGEFQITAAVEEFNVNSISNLFELITGNTISLPHVDIKMKSAVISIVSGKALSIILQDVEIAGHTAVNASLAITPTQAILRGDLSNDGVAFADVELRHAYLQVRFESVNGGKQTDVIVGGEVSFSSLTFDAAVHLYPAADGSGGIEWTVLATLTSADERLALSHVVPEVRSTFLDLTLRQVLFVAASKDDPAIGQMITSGYKFHQGVQICATLESIDPFNSLMRNEVPGLTLSAGWSKSAGFELDVVLPTATSLHFGNGISTTPMKLQIQTNPLNLILSAGLNVPVAKSPSPLVFTLSLAISLVGASATGEMAGFWVNPLGISPKVSIGPNLLLGIEIVYAQFASTGTPSGFGVRGGLTIGQTQAQVALNVSDDPMREVLYAELQHLNISDLVSFGEDLLETSIPKPPNKFLVFEDLKLYICPAGMTLGSIVYPQGFSFTADMVLFGKRANISCALDVNAIFIQGGVDNFQLGPLSVRGTHGPRATIDCRLGPSTQHVLIDGIVSFFDADAALHVEINVLPQPRFIFQALLNFTDILTFQLHAELIGAVSFESVQDADFVFDANFEQHILGYVEVQVMQQFEKARHVAEEGIDAAKAKVQETEKTVQDGIEKAQGELYAARASWEALNRKVTTEGHRVINEFNSETTRLQGEIDDARAAYNAALQNAQQAVQRANHDRAAKLADAQHAVDAAERDMVSKIASAQHNLNNAVNDMNARFGSAEQDIENARHKVQSLQDQIHDLSGKIRDYEGAPWYEAWKKGALVGLYAAREGVEGAKVIADGVLQAAEAILKGADYLGAKAAIGAARETLSLAQSSGHVALNLSKGFLKEVDTATRAAVDAAELTLRDVEKGGELLVLNNAIAALQVYKEANTAAFNAAETALEGLAESAEYLAYQEASAALAAAKAATDSLEAAKKALEVAEEVDDLALDVGKAIADRGLQAFNIRVIHLSGSLRGILDNEGRVSKPLSAHVEGTILDHSYTLDGKFDPRQTPAFITSIFGKAWDEARKQVLHLG